MNYEVDHDYGRGSVRCNDTAARAAVEGAGRFEDRFNAKTQIVWSKQIATTLDMLPSDGIFYLGSPYSLQASKEVAARIAADAAAELMRRGYAVFAPIPHGHFISHCQLPADWPFWKRQCEPFIDAAAALVVLKLDGWRDSVGLAYEIARFHEAGKPIVYVTMEDLAA